MVFSKMGLLAVAVAVGSALPGTAQTYGGLPADSRMQLILRCKAITDPTARATCYEESVKAPDAGAPVASAPGAAPAPALAEEPSFNVRRGSSRGSGAAPSAAVPPPPSFGMGAETLKSTHRVKNKQQAAERLVAHIADVQDQGLGYNVYTLDNGMVWKVDEHTSFPLPGVGDEVTIRHGSLGSYLMLIPGKTYIRVSRVR